MNSIKRNKIAPHNLKRIEAFRLSKKNRLKINVIHFFAIIAGAIIVIVLLQETESKVLPPVTFLFLASNFFYTVYIYFSIHKKYESHFNEKVLDTIIPQQLPGVDFLPHVSTDDVAELWKKSQPFRPSTIGYISTVGANKKSVGYRGVYQGLDFELYDVKIQKNHTQVEGESNRKVSNTETQFVGFLMRVKRTERIETPVYISYKNDTLNNPIADVIDGLIYKNHQTLTPPPKVSLGITAFEEQLTVYSDDKEVAKKLLTETIAAEILKSYNSVKSIRYTISFVDDQVYLIMDYQFGLFTAEIGKSVNDTETINEIFKPLLEKINFLKILS